MKSGDRQELAQKIDGIPQKHIDEIAKLIEELDGHAALGKYRLTKFLGSGGMGFVFECIDSTDTTLTKNAIKVARIGRVESSASRFEREVGMAKQIKHPCVIEIIDIDKSLEGNTPFFVMPRLYGEALSEALLNKGRLGSRQVLSYAIDITSALSSIHAFGTHRDLKPANIFLPMESHRPIILDFGLAKHTTPDNYPSKITVEGTCTGTICYASPEMYPFESSEFVGPHTDYFSLGCVLYECLSGQKAFPATSTIEYMQMLHDKQYVPVSLSKLAGVNDDKITSGLIELIEIFLEKDITTRRDIIKAQSLAILNQLEYLRASSLSYLTTDFSPIEPKSSAIDALTIDATHITDWIKEGLRLLGIESPLTLDGSARESRISATSAMIQLIRDPNTTEDYERLFGGFNTRDFFGFNAPFLFEENPSVIDAARAAHHERLRKVKSVRYIFIDEEAFDRGIKFFSLSNDTFSTDKPFKAEGYLFYWDIQDRATQESLNQCSYFVGYINNQPRCILYFIHPENRRPELALVVDKNFGLAEVLRSHWRETLKKIQESIEDGRGRSRQVPFSVFKEVAD